jgi:uncharacterized protein
VQGDFAKRSNQTLAEGRSDCYFLPIEGRMRTFAHYFRDSFLVTVVGLGLGFWVGWQSVLAGADPLNASVKAVFLCAVLGVLEISLSFDNAVVNAKILKDMTPLWRHRFLTWGILIAVFGMRLIFPLAIVGVLAKVNPWQAILLAARHPEEYAEMMKSVHVPVAAFGGAFLLLVGLKYFFDIYKDVHWIGLIERPISHLGRLKTIEIAIALFTIYLVSLYLPAEEVRGFLVSGLFGVMTFVIVDGVSSYLEDEMPDDEPIKRPGEKKTITDLHRASAGMFLYLEVLDASFSFDGVVGAFAITNNLFLITIGLGIGAMFVRSITLLLVDRGTLTEYRYLEHGAFYAILALALIMFLNTVIHIPEMVTGLIGAGLIGLAFLSSVAHNRHEKKAAA